jgi:hypothetical protein
LVYFALASVPPLIFSACYSQLLFQSAVSIARVPLKVPNGSQHHLRAAYAPAKNESSNKFFHFSNDVSHPGLEKPGFPCGFPPKLNIPTNLFQRCLGRCKSGNGHAKGRTGDIIQSRVVAETDGVGIAAMLSADAKFEFFAGLAPSFRRNFYQFTNPIDVE